MVISVNLLFLSIDYDLSGVFDQSPGGYMGLFSVGFKLWQGLFDRYFRHYGAENGGKCI